MKKICYHGYYIILHICLILGNLVFCGCSAGKENPSSFESDEGLYTGPDFRIPILPETYVCFRTNAPLIIDGIMNEEAWQKTDWTNPFMDIVGNREHQPSQLTRVKMLWDAEFFYVAAELEEKHVWASLHQRDTVIFYDNDFELFIDPDGDTHHYYELEVNAFGTVWDLMLAKPYRDGGPAISGWDINGLEIGVQVEGTINDPGSEDRSWTVEIALPWQVLKECAPGRRKPSDGDQWRVNFARVAWEVEVIDGKYVKRKEPDSGKTLPAINWVWSPQENVDMHAPETWGYVQFTDKLAGEGEVPFFLQKDEEIKWVLRRLYQLQRLHFENKRRFADSLEQLGLKSEDFKSYPAVPEFWSTPSMFEISLTGYSGTTWRINQIGKIWKSR